MSKKKARKVVKGCPCKGMLGPLSYCQTRAVECQKVGRLCAAWNEQLQICDPDRLSQMAAAAVAKKKNHTAEQ